MKPQDPRLAVGVLDAAVGEGTLVGSSTGAGAAVVAGLLAVPLFGGAGLGGDAGGAVGVGAGGVLAHILGCRLGADSAVLVAVPLGSASVDGAGVEAADLVAVAVGLEEEASAARAAVAGLLAVSDGLGLGVGTAVLGVGVADIVAAAVGEGDLAVFLAADEVLLIVASVTNFGLGGRCSRFEAHILGDEVLLESGICDSECTDFGAILTRFQRDAVGACGEVCVLHTRR